MNIEYINAAAWGMEYHRVPADDPLRRKLYCGDPLSVDESRQVADFAKCFVERTSPAPSDRSFDSHRHMLSATRFGIRVSGSSDSYRRRVITSSERKVLRTHAHALWMTGQ